MNKKDIIKQQGAKQELCPGLTLGTILQIMVKDHGLAMSSLVGMEKGVYLIVKSPPLINLEKKLFQKDLIIVRYFHTAHIFSFRSTVLDVIKGSFRLCILSYPTSVKMFNIRKHSRIHCLLPAEMMLLERSYYGFIEDISMGGCHLALNAMRDGKFPSIKVGDGAILFFNLPENKERIVLTINVVTIKSDIRTMKLGIQWKSIDQDAVSFTAISDFIAAFQQQDESDK